MSTFSLVDRLKQNWKSGLTVALVSIPLSVSLAVASQSTPVLGIVTAIWAGLFASLFGGSDFNIVGPTGALSGILATYAIAHGSGSLAMLAIVTGVFVLIAYAFKLERYMVFIPASTVHGFTLGVAFIIGLNQLNSALGLRGLPLHELFRENLWESVKHFGQIDLVTVCVFIVFLLALFVFAKKTPKLPGAIVLAPIGILLGYLSQAKLIPIALQTLGQKYANMQPVLFSPWEFTWDWSLIVAGLTVALIAILETMLSAKIADNMAGTKHNKRKEMLGLGLANIASGLMGGIPATAALARTSLNVKTGANNKMSATVSSVSIAVISLLLLGFFKYIPMAVIAAILVFVAIRMIEVQHLSHIWKTNRFEFALMMVVAIITIYEDPIVGILIGTAISLLVFVDKLSRGQFELSGHMPGVGRVSHLVSEAKEVNKQPSETMVYSIKGPLVYANAASHLERFEKGFDSQHVVLRFRELTFIDLDGIEAFHEMVKMIRGQGKQVYLSGVNALIRSLLAEDPVFLGIQAENHVFEKTSDALNYLEKQEK